MISLSYYYFISIQLKHTDASRCNTVLYLFFVSHYTVYLTLFTEDVNLTHPCLCIILINQIILYKFPLSILISTDNIGLHPLNYMSPGNFSVRLGKQTHRMSDRCITVCGVLFSSRPNVKFSNQTHRSVSWTD